MESQQIVSFGWEDFPLIESAPFICTYRPVETDEEHQSLNKRKYLPVIQAISSQIQIEPPAKLLAFGWADFPCVDYSSDFFSTTPFSLLSDSLHLFETPDLAELSNSSDESSDEEEARSQMNIANKKVQCSLASKVVFSNTMEVREYARTEGDHPFTPKFCLSLDWEYYPTVKMALPDGRVRKQRKPKPLSVRERRDRLEFAIEMADTVHLL